jgi:muramoyltetrapeptide carboxypeptidase
MSAVSNHPRIKPAPLRPGDTVGIVAPASNLKREALQAGCEALAVLGYKPLYSDSVFEQDIYFAGSVERRVRELHDMFRQDEVRAIICARGGYGANYLLGKIDLNLLRAHPKIFVGYSDISTLMSWFSDAAGLVTFHGPMAAKDWARPNGVDLISWNSALGGCEHWSVSAGSNMAGLADGDSEGVIGGGCLSMLAASLGTRYEIQTEGRVLFLEDVATKPYQIDRMLMQLKLAGKFAGVRGVIFGEMLDCAQAPDQPYTLQEVVMRVLRNLSVPVAFGLRSGHVSSRNITLPLGLRVRLQVQGEHATLTMLESATTSQPAPTQAVRA